MITDSTDTNENDDEKKEKRIAFYSAIVNAYIESSFEKDRSLLNLCSGGIGLLITLLSTIGPASWLELILYLVALLFFGSAILLIIYVLSENRNYLVRLNKGEELNETKLKVLDKLISMLFIGAVVVSLTIGVMVGIDKLNRKDEIAMSKEQKTPHEFIESVQGLKNLEPDFVRSLQGLSQLKPSQSDTSAGGDTDKTTQTDSKKEK
ncbi:MAG: hypothetical protein HY033_09795 [Ignavibacteriae bacterium]|nr:hypothetical protein [Ignavibacteria bacterium]MBI3365187.1 hypothetical protein [Ignavibacteriota bacterium]